VRYKYVPYQYTEYQYVLLCHRNIECEILESHTINEWLSEMNVKDEYVKQRVINPEGKTRSTDGTSTY